MPRERIRPLGTQQDRVLENVKCHLGLTDEAIKVMNESMVLHLIHLRRHNISAHIQQESTGTPTLDPMLISYENVPLSLIVETVETYIRRNVQHDRCEEVYHRVMATISGENTRLEWLNPNLIPRTQYSTSLAISEGVKSNPQLISELASLVGFRKGTAALFAAQITARDGSTNSAMICGYNGKTIQGARPGRDHTLEDVPNNYVRDAIMDINERVSPTRQHHVASNVFSNLSDEKITEYSALIEQDNEARRRGNDPLSLIGDPEFDAIRMRRPYRMTAIPLNSIRGPKDAQTFANQIKALKHIDANIDLTPARKAYIQRDYSRIEPNMRSVVRPLNNTYTVINNLLPEEETLHRFRVGTKIDRNCDQLRAMIKIFVTAPQRPFPGERLYNEADDPYCWTLDRFRVTLKGILRPEFTAWLNQRGPTAGQANKIYQLVWEFFRKRELLGLELVQSGVEYENENEHGDLGPRQGVETGSGGDGRGTEYESVEGPEERVTTQDAPIVLDDEGDDHQVEGQVVDVDDSDADADAEKVGNDDENKPEEVESDEFHDARETPGHHAISVLNGEGQSATGEIWSRTPTGSHDTAEEGEGEAERGSEEEDEVESKVASEPGLDSDLGPADKSSPPIISPLRRSKRGHVPKPNGTEVAVEPAPPRKRLRSGRTL